jgi:uncharacterized membrane protein YgcG
VVWRRAVNLLGTVGIATALTLTLAASVAAAPPAGPPYPNPVDGQRVYDYAGIFSQEQIASAEATIAGIENRTGAEVTVYTQVKPESDTLDKVNQDALDLMNQWHVGRKGFDDGLVILFDMQPNLCHGQVSLYAGSGYKAAYLSNSDRQRIFDDDMMPYLRVCDMNAALKTALSDVDAVATPEHAAQLNQARVLNAAVGLGVLVLSIFLALFALLSWYTRGRDPMYLDDNSILMPAPPPNLTPAMATLLMDDKTSNRTVSAAMVDFAARGLVRFYEEAPGSKKLGIGIRRASVPLPSPEARLWERMGRPATGTSLFLRLFGGGPHYTPAGLVSAEGVPADPSMARYVEPSSMSTLAAPMASFKSDLESSSVENRWLTGRPTGVMGRWLGFAFVQVVGAGLLVYWSMAVEASGGILGAIGLGCSAIVTGVLAFLMPSRTMTGSMLRAQLLAYKRTLAATMAMSNSMDEVVQRKAVPWIETPDQAMAWGVALGLNDEIDGVLKRTAASSAASGHATGWYPGWWFGSGYTSGGWGFAGGSGGGSGGGLYSSSMVPDVGGMMSALGSIGSSTSSSGGGGGFGGGGGGGGGGAGGGF